MSTTPDFDNRFRRTVLRLGEPDRVPLGEFTIHKLHKEKLLGRPLRAPEDEVEFRVKAGFDYVTADVGLHTTSAIRGTKATVEAQYSMFDYGETEREWVMQDKSLIRTEADFESFPWPDPELLDYTLFEHLSELIPPGMKIMGTLGKIFNSVWWFMGFEHFARSLIENPSLVQRVFDKIATIQLGVLDRMLAFDAVGGVLHADDLAYAEALMVGPEHLRHYLFPWLKELSDRVHAKGKLAIFHSDGKLDQIMPDLIECGFDAIHPFEPKAMDIAANKRQYGDRICVMGNIDLGYTLTRGTPEEVTAECRLRIGELGPGGGYCLSSSNSVPEYVPHENFLAMLKSVIEYGNYPISVKADIKQTPEYETEIGVLSVSPSASSGDPLVDELMDTVIEGLSDEAGKATEEAIAAGANPHELFELALVPAMIEVGRRMETSEFFIPQVLLAAKAMNVSLVLLKPLLVEATALQRMGTVVIGSVKGDLHDIGKNLVGMMLEGNGFRVIDLGVDVSPHKFVEAVRENRADIVALSALLTTTMMGMKGVLDALIEAGLRDGVKVIVGGAPVSEDYAKEVGADGFAFNAAAGARVAKGLLSNQAEQ